MKRLTISYGNRHLKTYELSVTSLTVGRLPENTISIANMGISRRHFRIELGADRKYLINDLNSLNGITINGRKASQAILNDGDIISIGKYAIQFEVLDDVATEELDNNVSYDVHSEQQNHAVSGKNDQVSSQGEVNQNTFVGTEDIFAHSVLDNNDEKKSPVLIEVNKHVVYKLNKPILSLGSSENDDIFITGFMIKGEHLLLEKEKSSYWMRAIRSFARFKVNGKKVREHLLQHKDRIEIGVNTFRYMLEEE